MLRNVLQPFPGQIWSVGQSLCTICHVANIPCVPYSNVYCTIITATGYSKFLTSSRANGGCNNNYNICTHGLLDQRFRYWTGQVTSPNPRQNTSHLLPSYNTQIEHATAIKIYLLMLRIPQWRRNRGGPGGPPTFQKYPFLCTCLLISVGISGSFEKKLSVRLML